MKRTVAVKVINRALFTDSAVAGRFGREMEAAGKLTHPNIVHAYDAERIGDTHFLAMEYVEGLSLAKLLAQRGPLPVAEACSYIRQAALGLQHAHERGMVHRDIKPQNLMVTARGQVKILDFGLARFVLESVPAGALLASAGAASAPAQGEVPVEPLTQVGTLMGTPAYIAPEQARDPHSADIRADIYSLGCTLYDLLTGRPPFSDKGARRKEIGHLREAAPSLLALRPDVPRELAQVVEAMLAHEPAQRYQVPAEVADALRPWVEDTEIGEGQSPSRVTQLVDRSPSSTPLPPSLPGPRRRRPWRLVLATCVAVALGVLGYLVVAPIRDNARLLLAPQVLVSRPVERQVADYEEFKGQINAAQAIRFRSLVSGCLQKIGFREGDLVQKGQVLFEIDPEPIQMSLETAKAKAKIYEAQLKEKTTKSPETTKADLKAVQTEINRLTAELRFTTITSPFSGRAGRLYVSAGEHVKESETVLTTLVSEDFMWVYFNVPEATALRIRPLLVRNTELFARLAHETDYRHKAVLEFAENHMDNGSLTVRAELPNPLLPGGNRLLTAGMTVHLRLFVSPPHSALFVKEPGPEAAPGAPLPDFLYVVDDQNRVVRRSVTWGQEHDGLREVREGLKAGERVIVGWTKTPLPGEIVQTKEVEMPGSPPEPTAPKENE